MISVVVTFHNNEKYIDECLKSILSQTYSNIEIIIINDGSDDNTEIMCKKYEKAYENISYFYLEHEGVSVARNKGIDESKGEYIMFVDGDDCLKPTIIEELLVESKKNIDIISSGYVAFNDSGTVLKDCKFFNTNKVFRSNEEKQELYLQLLDGNKAVKGGYTAIGVPWGKLYKSEFLRNNNLRFKKGLLRMQDNVFNMYAFQKSDTIVYVDKPLYMYRIDNIVSYTKAYDPKIYFEVAEERYKFLNTYTDLLSDDVINSFYVSFISLCMISIKNIAISNKRKDAIKKIKALCNTDLYIKFIKKKDIIGIGKKDKAAKKLIELKLYVVLYYMLRLKNKLR